MLEREVKFCDRYKTQVSIVFIDLDKFKPINDTHGHLRGSHALREVGFLLRTAVRDILAQALAQKLREQMKRSE
jgi:diguanylate cyclase (GGDEF)-like protein